jgi:hypothetical protein
MTEASIVRRKLDLGRVVGDTFAVVRRRASVLFGVTLAFYMGLAIIIAIIVVGSRPSPLGCSGS